MTLRSWLTSCADKDPFSRRLPTPLCLPGGLTAILDPYNARLKVYDVIPSDFLPTALARKVLREDCDPELISKVTLYARPGGEDLWKAAGFLFEGRIQGYFADGIETSLWAAYTDPARATEPRTDEFDKIVELAQSKKKVTPELSENLVSRLAIPGDAAELAVLMQSVFPEYPTPLDEAYIQQLLNSKDFLFRLVYNHSGELVASASAELDHIHKVAEMTDCATRPDYRGQGLMAYLLFALASDVPGKFGINNFYTIARAEETGMNCVFGKLGYEYTGRLINNCRMPSGWESMNIWCRQQ